MTCRRCSTCSRSVMVSRTSYLAKTSINPTPFLPPSGELALSTTSIVPPPEARRELRRIPLPRTWVNRAWALLRASPLHGVDDLLRLGRELIELASRTIEAHRNRLTLYVLQDDAAHLVSFKSKNWSASAPPEEVHAVRVAYYR